MFQRYVFVVCILRPSNRVILAFITPSSVGTSECVLVFIAAPSVEISESGCRLRLRTSSPVQSNPFRFSLVSFVCFPCCLVCACCRVLHVFSLCFRVFLPTSASLGFQPSLLAGPRRCLSPSFALFDFVFVLSVVWSLSVWVEVLHMVVAGCLKSLPFQSSKHVAAQCCSRAASQVLVVISVWCWLWWCWWCWWW